MYANKSYEMDTGISLCTVQRPSICDSKSKIHHYCKIDYIKHIHKRIKGYDKLEENLAKNKE